MLPRDLPRSTTNHTDTTTCNPHNHGQRRNAGVFMLLRKRLTALAPGRAWRNLKERRAYSGAVP